MESQFVLLNVERYKKKTPAKNNLNILFLFNALFVKLKYTYNKVGMLNKKNRKRSENISEKTPEGLRLKKRNPSNLKVFMWFKKAATKIKLITLNIKEK
tara:strand:+ start:229 stop:525 length:297 start_codon:yes stop_codon:yes gene_type:complete